MALSTLFLIGTILTLSTSPISSQSPPFLLRPLSPSPAPAPAPQIVDLNNLLSVAGPFQTFLNLLIQTNVIQTFQNQANNTKQGITIFVPSDSAFADIQKPSLTNLTNDQLKSLLLYHAFPQYYSLSDFKNLSIKNPVSTFAGGQYTLNLTDNSGLIQVDSDWSNPKISSSVYTAYPVAVYELNSVLLPKAIVTEAPVLTPAPAPAPLLSPSSDLAPAGGKGRGEAPKSSESNNNDSSSPDVAVCRLSYLLAATLWAILLMV